VTTAWERAAAVAFASDLPTGVVPPNAEADRARAVNRAIADAPREDTIELPPLGVEGPGPPLVVVDHFDLNMIDMTDAGAFVLVVQISRSEAMSLVRKHNPPVFATNERGQSDIEKDLQLDPLPRPQLRFGTRLLVRSAPRWNDVRFFIVELKSDGYGCVP